MRGLAQWRSKEIESLVERGLEQDMAVRVFDETEAKRAAAKSALGRLKTWAVGGLTPAEEEYASKYDLQESRIKQSVIEKLQAEHLRLLLAQKEAEQQKTGGTTSAQQNTFNPDLTLTSTPPMKSSPFVSDGVAETVSDAVFETSVPSPVDMGDKVEKATATAEKQAKSSWNSITGWFKGNDPK